MWLWKPFPLLPGSLPLLELLVRKPDFDLFFRSLKKAGAMVVGERSTAGRRAAGKRGA